MLRATENEGELERPAAAELFALLQSIASIQIERVDRQLRPPGPDIVAEVRYHRNLTILLSEVKSIEKRRTSVDRELEAGS